METAQSSRRPAAILGHSPRPSLWRRPVRAAYATAHRLSYRLYRWSMWRLDDDQAVLLPPQVEMAEEQTEFWCEKAQATQREAAELSEMVGQWHEKWKQAWNRLREYESHDGEPV